jgi:hypothetical protein
MGRASEDFTIEKFKIHERLAQLEISMAQVLAAITDLKMSKNDVHTHLSQEIDNLKGVLYGVVGDEEKPGIIVSMAILKNEAKNRDRIIGFITAAFIALAVGYIWNRVVK